MRNATLLSFLAPFSLVASALSQGEVLYYKFDANGGTKVINYAPATSPAPEEGTITSTDTTAWTSPGKFGLGALRGGGTGGATIKSYVDSGWNGAFTGSFTVAWFMMQRNAPPSTSYFISGIGSFRCFTGGVANQGLMLRVWGGTPADLTLTTDVQLGSTGKWLHVALVVDATASTATWYVDGVAQPVIPIVGAANVVPGTRNFLVNDHFTTSGPSYYDMDEFRFYNRAATAAEVMSWANVNLAADSAYGKGCNATLASTGGAPTVGNNSYALALTGTANAAWILGIGSNRLNFGGVPLPFDLGAVIPSLAGCTWETSGEVFVTGVLDASGNGSLRLPIPSDRALDGASVYTQAFVTNLATSSTTNPFAISVGN